MLFTLIFTLASLVAMLINNYIRKLWIKILLSFILSPLVAILGAAINIAFYSMTGNSTERPDAILLGGFSTVLFLPFIIILEFWLINKFRSTQKFNKNKLAQVSTPPAITSPDCDNSKYQSPMDQIPDIARIVETTIPSGPSTMTNEDHIYAAIANELETGMTDKGLWTRLFAECSGDESQTKVLYIKQRAHRLIAAEQARLEQAAQERTAELMREEQFRPAPTNAEQISIQEKIAVVLNGNNSNKETIMAPLIQNGATIKFLNKCRHGELDEIQSLLEQEPYLLASSTTDGDTCLHIAVSERRLPLLKMLIEKGAVPNARNHSGKTALDMARSKNQYEFMSLLEASQERMVYRAQPTI